MSKMNKMKTTEWRINEPKPHIVRLDHGFWLSDTVIYVDDNEIFRRSGKFWDTGLEHRFNIDGIPCIIRIIFRTFIYTYELWVDGKLQ